MSEPRAFPSINPVDAWGSDEMGMTLRDYFAAKALQAFCSQKALNNWTIEEVASYAYAFADAMLRARQQP